MVRRWGADHVRFEHGAFELRILLRQLAQLEAEFIARAHPGQPADLAFGQQQAQLGMAVKRA